MQQQKLRNLCIKSLYRHSGNRFVWNESGRTQYARRVQTMDGLQLNRHPVKTIVYWMLVFTNMTVCCEKFVFRNTQNKFY